MKLDKLVLNTISLEFSATARKMNREKQVLISLGLGEPNFDTPEQVTKAAVTSIKLGETKYSSPWGLEELRNKLYENYVGSIYSEKNAHKFVVTNGAKHALTLALSSLLEPDDEVVVLSPNYVSYKPQILLSEPQAKIVECSLCRSEFGLQADDLRKVITPRTKVLLLNFPNNPTGSLLCESEIKKIVLLAKEKGVFIVCDEIYSKQLIGNAKFISFGQYIDTYDKIIILDGFSKSFAMTGWRIGFMFAPEEIAFRCVQIQQHSNTNVPVFIQRAGLAALDLPDSFVDEYNHQLTLNEAFLNQKLCGISGISYRRPKGGMFAFIDISTFGKSSDQFATSLLKDYRVAITPGVVFGESWDGFARVSLAQDTADFSEGVERLCSYIASLQG